MTPLKTAQQRIAEAGKQEAVAWKYSFFAPRGAMDCRVDWVTFDKSEAQQVGHFDVEKLYLRPDYASAARIKELEAEFNQCSGMLDNAERSIEELEDTNTALREKLLVVRGCLKTIKNNWNEETEEACFACDSAMSKALATIGDE